MAQELWFVAADGILDTGRTDCTWALEAKAPFELIGSLLHNYGVLLIHEGETFSPKWKIRVVVNQGEPAFKDEIAVDSVNKVDKGLEGLLNMAPNGVLLTRTKHVPAILNACSASGIQAHVHEYRGGLATSQQK